jgi:6-pyruvoyltetrahydropterin/6-carboxytetrahydropterin synthase
MSKIIVSQKIHFNCAVRLFNPDWDAIKNKEFFLELYSENGFGHNFVLEASISFQEDKNTILQMHPNTIKTLLKTVTTPLDHKFLNKDVAEFSKIIPTTENIALYCYNQFKIELLKVSKNSHLEQITLREGSDYWVEIREN